MRIDVGKKDVIWSYIGVFMSLISNIIILPFLIYFLDGDMLGLWYIFTSIGAIATLFDFGFGVTFARNITYCWSGVSALEKEGAVFADSQGTNYRLMANVLKTCRVIYSLIAGLALVLLLIAGTGYILYVARSVSNKSYLIAWFIYVTATFLNLYYGYYASFLRGVGAVGQASKNTVIARTIQIAVTVFLLFMGTGIIGACIAYFLYGIVFRILGKRKFYKYKDIGRHLDEAGGGRADRTEMKELFVTVWHNAWREGVITICNYLSNQAGTLICSVYFSLEETGIYSLGVQIASAISTIAAALYTAYQPALQAAYIKQDKEKMKNTMSLIMVAYMVIFVFGTLGTIFVGLPVLRLVKPESIVSVPVLLGLCLYQFILKFRNCYTSYFSCTNRIWYVKSFVIAAMLCVVLSLLFTGGLRWGMWGMITAQILSQAIYNMWAWAVKAHREMELPFFSMFERAKNEGFRLAVGKK